MIDRWVQSPALVPPVMTAATSAQVPGVLAADAAPARRQRGQLQLEQLRAQQLDARDQARRQLLVGPGARHPQPPQPRRQPQRLQQRLLLCCQSLHVRV
jgi:hypothetical protein